MTSQGGQVRQTVTAYICICDGPVIPWK